MKACLDVHYHGHTATAAAVVFDHWHDETPRSEVVVEVAGVGDYQPGRFYLRELEPLMAVVSQLEEAVEVFVIDAYCHLSADREPGLGAYLHERVASEAVVVGVAKSRFRGTTHARELLRGDSRRPLFVTSIGVDDATAARWIASMAGAFRIPTLIKAADRLCRRR